MKWNFIKYPAGMKIRDSMVAEFFSVDAIDKPAQALIREAIQNSLDARPDKSQPLKIRVFLGKVDKPSLVKNWLDGTWEHYDADRKLENKPNQNDVIPYLVFEDFETTGLQGDINQDRDIENVKNPFFYFYRAEGRSGKGGSDGGRWGVGKHVFADVSRIRTFWGLTVRKNDNQKLLMGCAVLSSHIIGNDSYTPDGYFGLGDGFTLPLSDPKIIDQFSIDFNVSRKKEPGLSVVVLHIDEDITFENIQNAIIEEYFYPILKGDLIVNVETIDKSVQINNGTFSKISNNSLPIYELVNKSLSNVEGELFILNPCDTQRPAWDKELIPSDMLLQMREKFDGGEILAVQMSLTIRPKFGEEQSSYFRVYIKQDKDEVGTPIFVRSGLVISRVNAHPTRGVRSLVVIEDGPLVKLLGDSENPAHNEWHKKKIKDKYVNASSYINFVANIVSNLVMALAVEVNTVDENLLSDIFSLPITNEDQPKRTTDNKNNKPGTVVKPPPPPIQAREKKFVLSQIKGGFSITPSKEKIELPLRIEVQVAYDVRKGSALGRYNISDFRLDQLPVKIKKPLKGLRLVKVRENMILMDVLKDDFELIVTGFDENRDLYVKVKLNEDNNDQEI
jgi:hypothetical protein